MFGHSHVPLVRPPAGPSGFWLVNPGSPTDRRWQPAFSWALMTIESGSIEAVELLTYADRSV